MKPENQRVKEWFLDYLKVEKGLALLTVRAYQSDLIQFTEFLESRRRGLLQARREDVRAFMSQLFSNGVGDRSVARKLSTLRHFYKYLLLDRMIQHDPTLEIDSPRQWKVLPKSLAGSEIDLMLKSAGAKSERPKSHSMTLMAMRALIWLWMPTALRGSIFSMHAAVSPIVCPVLRRRQAPVAVNRRMFNACED